MGLPRVPLKSSAKQSIAVRRPSGVVLTDRALGGADTLATSYSLAQAVKKMTGYDIILGGRQAIDGDTAQVGPQIAENSVCRRSHTLKRSSVWPKAMSP